MLWSSLNFKVVAKRPVKLLFQPIYTINFAYQGNRDLY